MRLSVEFFASTEIASRDDSGRVTVSESPTVSAPAFVCAAEVTIGVANTDAHNATAWVVFFRALDKADTSFADSCGNVSS